MPRRQRHLSMAQGSGFFISADGYIVTNNHVVDHATEVTVTTSDGKTLAAKVIGTDAKTDLALLKVKDAGTYPFVNFASQSPRVGDWVIAVGNPFGLGGTVTAGIVSARGRDIGSGPYDDFLQIDAPVNHGNSGGPTFNTDGEVVGVNTAIFSPSGGSVGIGFAIASDVVKNVVQQLKDDGAVARGWLGVEIQPVTPDLADSLGVKNASGALVAKETANSPAASAGVKIGDVITAVNGDAVADPRDLARRIAALGPQKTADLAIWRNGAQQTIAVTLGAMPMDKEANAETPAKAEEATPFAKLGLSLERARGGEGVAVADVDPDGVAAERGLQAGDVILEAGGKPVDASRRSRRGLRGRQGGRTQIGAAAREVRGGRALPGAAGPGGVLISRAWPRRPCEAIEAGSRASLPRSARAGEAAAGQSPHGLPPYFLRKTAEPLYVVHADSHHRRRPRRGGLSRQGVPRGRLRRRPRRRRRQRLRSGAGRRLRRRRSSTACCPRWTDCR